MLVDLNRFEQRQQPRDTHQIGVQEMGVSRRRLHPGVLVEMGVESKMRGNSCEIRVSREANVHKQRARVRSLASAHRDTAKRRERLLPRPVRRKQRRHNNLAALVRSDLCDKPIVPLLNDPYSYGQNLSTAVTEYRSANGTTGFCFLPSHEQF